MPNMFKCTLASGGGDGADLIVTCSSNFAGSVITCTDGSSYTKTQTCPSSSPYEVTFESIPTGTYTISGVVSGQTFSTTKTILDFDAELNAIPDGSTVTPTDDIQIWLHCANIWNKTYTTISQILSDASSLQALIASNNAADYMARSTTWASDVTADSSAMTYIGLNDYCADSLLADSTWLNAICNSTYFESILTTKVPNMTSDTTPSGEVIHSQGYSSWYPYYAFNDNALGAVLNAASEKYIGYRFTSNTAVSKLMYKLVSTSGITFTTSIKLQASSDGTTWTDLMTINISDVTTTTNPQYFNVINQTKYLYYRLLGDWNTNGNGTKLQFYGRT